MKRKQVKHQIDLIDYQELQKAQNQNNRDQDISHISKSQAQGPLVFQLDSPKVNNLQVHTQQLKVNNQSVMRNQEVQAQGQEIFKPFTYQIELNSEKSQQQRQEDKFSNKNQVVQHQNTQGYSNKEKNLPEQNELKTESYQEDQREDRIKRRKNKSAFKDIVNGSDTPFLSNDVKNEAQTVNNPRNVDYGKLQEHSQSENQRTDIHTKAQPINANQGQEVLRSKEHYQPKQFNRLPPLKQQTVNKKQQEFNFLYNENSMVGLEKFTDQANYQEKIFSSFAFKPVPQGNHPSFTFKREKKFLQNYYRPQYSLAFTNEKLVFSARKEWGNINSKYNISCEQKNYSRFGNYYAGFLKANFTGSCYNLYSCHDEHPEIVATIVYKSEFKCIQPASRNTQVYLLNQDYAYNELAGYVQNQEIGLDLLYQISDNSKTKRIIKLVNKKPRWCYSLNTYTLNFKGKLKVPSVKNMILVEEDNQRQSVLMLCKESQNEFYVQVGSPLNPYMAMGIILTSFDFKLCCQ